MTKGEMPPANKTLELTNEIVFFLNSKLINIVGIKILKEKFMPKYGIQVIFQDPEIGEVRVSVFSNLEGENSDEFVITDMTTLPVVANGKGYGKSVIDNICEFLKTKNEKLKFVRAVQVSGAKGFWEKCGFIAIGNVTSDYELANFKDNEIQN